MLLLVVVVLPLVYVATLLVLAYRREFRDVGWSIICAAAAIVTWIWAIMQSRSSTAAIGLYAVPPLGALAGFLGILFGRFRSSTEIKRRIVAWAAIAATVMLVAWNIAQGNMTRATNAARDQRQAQASAQIVSYRDLIDAALAANKGHERQWLDSSIRANMNDRAFVLAALPHDSISPDLLNILAESPDLGIALETVRNPSTPSETLERVYRTRSYPDYFFQALAANHHTPPAVLTEIAGKTTNPAIIALVLQNPAVSCTTLTLLSQKRAGDPANVARLDTLLRSKCAKGP